MFASTINPEKTNTSQLEIVYLKLNLPLVASEYAVEYVAVNIFFAVVIEVISAVTSGSYIFVSIKLGWHVVGFLLSLVIPPTKPIATMSFMVS